jgi:hypothetical protein
MPIRLDRNGLLFNPCPESHLEAIQLLVVNSLPRIMDSEVEALEKRLAKTRALKQGMMQELLTGKTRLA